MALAASGRFFFSSTFFDAPSAGGANANNDTPAQSAAKLLFLMCPPRVRDVASDTTLVPVSASAGARALVLILQLCERLAEPGPQWRSIAAELGIDGLDPRLPQPHSAGTPADDCIVHAVVLGDPRTGVTREIRLWPVADPDAPLTASALQATLGGSQQLPRALGGRPGVEVYTVEKRGRTVTVTSEESDGRVALVTIGR